MRVLRGPPLARADLAQHVRGGKDTVNAALREVLEHWRLALALTRLRGTVADGAFDLALLQDKQHHRR